MNTENCLRTTELARVRAPAPTAWLRAAGELLRVWHQRARDRRELLQLDARQLRDIGVFSEDVLREAQKPFWRE